MAENPKGQWNLFHILIKGWSDFWNQKVDEVWPTREQLDNYLKEIQKKAFEEFYQQKVKETEARAMGQGGAIGQPGASVGVPGASPSPMPIGGGI